MDKTDVMIVEDETVIALELSQTLEMLGYNTAHVAFSGDDAISMVGKRHIDLALVDINLDADIDGIEVGKSFASHAIPVIYLTAYSDEDTLRKAAVTRPFGYLVKPYDIETLNATIRMALKKSAELKAIQAERSLDDLEIRVDDLTVNLVTREVSRAGEVIELTTREFDLLSLLAEHAGEIVTRKQILDKVWYNYRSTSSNVVDVYIRYLREKIDQGHAVKLIHTVRKKGYMVKR